MWESVHEMLMTEKPVDTFLWLQLLQNWMQHWQERMSSVPKNVCSLFCENAIIPREEQLVLLYTEPINEKWHKETWKICNHIL